MGWIIYLGIGVALAFLLNVSLGVLLSTDFPVVTVESDSMEPALYPGDIVFVRGVDSYDPGDIIIFDGWKRTPIIHRTVSASRREDGVFEVLVWQDFDEITEEELIEMHKDIESEEVYVTKGDNNPTCDQCQNTADLVELEDVHGRKLFRIPYLGWIKLFTTRLFSIFMFR